MNQDKDGLHCSFAHVFLAKEIKIWVMSGSSKESLWKVYDFDSSPEAPEKGDASKLSGQEG